MALAWSLGPGRVAAIPKAPNPAPYLLYRLEWTRALNAREVSCRRLKWPRPSWIRQTFCTFVEPCREAAPFRSIDFSPLVSSCRASPALILSYLVLASVALVFSCLGRLWNRAGKHRRFGAQTSPHLVSSCRASPGLILSYLVLASVALVFSCLGFSCLRLLWSPLVVSPVVLSSLVLVPACSLWGLLGSLFGASGGTFWASGSPPGASWDRLWPS